MSLVVRVAEPVDMPAVYALRHDVFVLGQAVPAELERDELDDVGEHVVAVRDAVVVGTGRLVPLNFPESAVGVVGRLAVAAADRGSGTGRALLDRLEGLARQRGFEVVELHAQVHARGFYERAGYLATGPVYVEAGIDHVSMRKQLAH